MHKVWSATSGSVNTFEAVERHAIEWVKSEDTKYKRREKVKKWREIQTKEKEERLRAAKEKVQECHDCEKKVATLAKMSENRAKLAEWQQIKAMKEELKKADDLVKTVKQIEHEIVKKPKKQLIQRPKSAKNLLKRPEEAANKVVVEKLSKFEQKKILESFQQRDQEMVQKKLEQKLNAKMAEPDLSLKIPKKCVNIETERDHFLKPTFASLSKFNQNCDDPDAVFGYEYAPELETKLMQIENIPRLGMPTWRADVNR